MINCYGETSSLEDYPSVLSPSTPEWEDVMMTVQEVYNTYTPVESGFVSRPVTLTQDACTSRTGRYACGVSALYIIAMYYNVIGLSNLETEYPLIWDYTNTYYIEGSDTFGETLNTNFAPGFQTYAQNEHNRTFTSTTYTTNMYNAMVSAVKNKDMPLFSGAVGGSGHAMAVEGYVRVTATGAAIVNMFVVADGWTNTLKYINFDSPLLTTKKVIVFHAK